MKPGLAHLVAALTLALPLLARADIYADVIKLQRAGQLAEAQDMADQHLKAHPRDPQMRYLKGLIQRDGGHTPEALDTFTRLTEDYPELPEPYNSVAVIEAAQGNYDKAILALQGAIHANPAYGTAYENLGDLYAKLATQSYCRALKYAGKGSELPAKLRARSITCP